MEVRHLAQSVHAGIGASRAIERGGMADDPLDPLLEHLLHGHGIRLPLTQLSEQHHETMRQAMRQAGII